MLSWQTYLPVSSLWEARHWTFVTAIPAPLSGHTNIV
jgi:hypothetical protein